MDRDWIEEGKRRGATHVVVMLDTLSHEEFPLYVMPGELVLDLVSDNSASGVGLLRIYNLALDFDEQCDPRSRRLWRNV